MEWGIYPRAMIGHSIGEYVAACLAGVFSLEDALALVAKRGQLMEQMPAGAMLALNISEQQVQPLLNDDLCLAAVNGPSLCVLSGPTDAIDEWKNSLQTKAYYCRRLHTSHAFHSSMMDPIVWPFIQQVQTVSLHPPQIPYISNVTGTWITAEEATNPSYWGRQLRQTVRFADGLQALLTDPQRLFLEVGPGQTLSTLARQQPGNEAEQVLLSSIRTAQDQQSDVAFLLNTLGRLWLCGIRWIGTALLPMNDANGCRCPRIRLNGRVTGLDYPNQQAAGMDAADHKSRPRRRRSGSTSQPGSWPRRLRLLAAAIEGRYKATGLYLAMPMGWGRNWSSAWRTNGQEITSVVMGEQFTRLDAHTYAIRPQQRDDYEALLIDFARRPKLRTPSYTCGA